MNTVKTMAPTDLRDYLVKAHGWQVLEQGLNDRLFVFKHAAYERRQLIYPMDSTALDYDEAVSRVFEKLSEMLKTTQDSLREAAKNLRDDIITLRIHSENQGYTLPLSFASSLIQNTEKLLKSAACTVLQPERHYRKLYKSEVSQFIDKTRFQQTERGSFVLKISCPMDAVEAQSSMEFEGQKIPFGRQVTTTLHSAISMLVRAIEADKLDELMAKLSQEDKPLISSNFCDALAQMQDEKIENSLDFGVNWSALYALPKAWAGAQTVRLQRDYFRRIEEVGRSLRSDELHREDTFVGTVERLDGTMDDTGHRSGDVVLSLMLPDGDGLVRAKASLNADRYATALRAHETDGAFVQVKGRLHAGQRIRQLTHLKSFEIIDADRVF